MRTYRTLISLTCLFLLGGTVGSACSGNGGVKQTDVIELPPAEPWETKSPNEWFDEANAFLSQAEPNYERAILGFENALKHDPDFPEAHVNLGLVHETIGNYSASIEHRKRATELAPEDPNQFVALGRVQLKNQMYGPAQEALSQALTLDTKHLGALNHLALAYLMQNRLDDAERITKEVMAIDPDNVMGLYNLGKINLAREKTALAQYVFQRAITSTEDKNARVLNHLGLIAFNEGKIPKAVNLFKDAIKNNPEYVPALVNLGTIYLDYLDYAAALEQFRVAHESDPSDSAAHLGYAASLYGTGDHAEAARLYESYDELYPESTQPATRLSVLYERQLNDMKKSCKWYEKRVAQLSQPNVEISAVRDFVCKQAKESE